LIQKFFSKLPDKEKKVFYITLLIVSLAFLDRLFLGPVLDRLQTIDEEIERQRNGIIRDLRLLSYKDHIIQEGEAYNKYFTSGMKDVDVVNAEFLQAIERLASQAKVNLVKSNPTESKKLKRYTEYYANLDLNGPLENVVTFMHMVNTSDELLKVVRFSMTPKRGANEVNSSMTIVRLIIAPELSDDSTNP